MTRLAVLAAALVLAAFAAVFVARAPTSDDRRDAPADPPVRPVAAKRVPRVHRPEVPPSPATPAATGDEPVYVAPPRHTVRGRIVHAAAHPPSLARVALARIDETHPADPRRLAVAEPSVWLEDATEFVLHPPASGRWLLGVVFCDGTVGATATVDVGDDEGVSQDLAVPALEVRERVLVRVVEPDGRLARDAAVQAGFTVAGRPEADVDTIVRLDGTGTASVLHDFPGAPRSGIEGSERLRLGDRGAAPELRHFVEATSPRFPPRRVAYDPRTDAEVTIRFVEPALLSVTVDGLTKSPDCDQLRVVLVPKTGGEPVGRTYEGECRFAFRATTPGDYELRLELARRDEPLLVLSRQDLALMAGERRLALDIPRLCELTVDFPEQTRQVVPRLVRVGPAGAETVALRWEMRQRRMRIQGLVTSRYRLEIQGSGEITFDLANDLTLEWRPGPMNALRVVFHDGVDDAAVLDAGLLAEDLVAAIEGEEVDARDWRGRIQRGSKVTRLAVLRNGRRFDVDVPTAIFFRRNYASWLEPASR